MPSQTAEYALRAAVYLTEHPTDRPARVGDLARALKVPQNYLSKTLHQLARAGVLISTRGKKGGFRLARAPKDISLLDVVAPFEDLVARNRCPLGHPVCNDRTPCGAHRRWKKVARASESFFAGTTLWDLVRPRPVRR
jgi:Rrf2 family iron-sulfur cluster assembly transcriptional regulator